MIDSNEPLVKVTTWRLVVIIILAVIAVILLILPLWQIVIKE